MQNEITPTTIIKESARLIKKYPEVRGMTAHNYLKGMEQVALIGILALTAKSPKIGLLRKGFVIGSAVAAYLMSLEYRAEMEADRQMKIMAKVTKDDMEDELEADTYTEEKKEEVV